MAYKIKTFEAVRLYEKDLVGYLIFMKDTSTNYLCSLWGTSDYYIFLNWGISCLNGEFGSYSDGLLGQAWVTEISRAVTVDKVTDTKIEATSKSVTSITRVGTVATATVTAHGYAENDKVTIAGADQPSYNGYVTISNITADTFDYTAAGSPTTPATGTITCIKGARLDYSTISLNIDHALIGIRPYSLDESGITKTKVAGETASLSEEMYQAYGRSRGWLLSDSANLAVVATAAKFYTNFLSYCLIANFIEVLLIPNATDAAKLDAEVARVANRVRWGNTGCALCGDIVAEDPDANNAGFVDLIETPGPITGILALDDRAIVTKAAAIYHLTYAGYPNYFTPALIAAEQGTIASKSLKRWKNGFVFLGRDSIYFCSMDKGLSDIGGPLKNIFFGFKPLYTSEELKTLEVISFEDRNELWLWVPGSQESIVYKLAEGGWFRTDYSEYGLGNLTCISVSKLEPDEEMVPVLFFDQDDAVVVDGSTATIRAFYDLQVGCDTDQESVFETIDFHFGEETRVSALKFQAKCDEVSGSLKIQYSLNEGATWSDVETITIDGSPELDFYRAFINETAESIRFKVSTNDPISLGSFKLVIVDRKKPVQALRKS